MQTPDSPAQKLDAWLALTREGLQPGQMVSLPVLSGSMLPDLPLGALLEIEPVLPRDCRYGDVIIFQEGPEGQRRLIAHRIIGRLGFGSRLLFLQKGDANAFGHWASSSRVCGRVRRVIPSDGDESAAIAASSVSRADRSRYLHFRNLILYWPRRIRDAVRRRQQNR